MTNMGWLDPNGAIDVPETPAVITWALSLRFCTSTRKWDQVLAVRTAMSNLPGTRRQQADTNDDTVLPSKSSDGYRKTIFTYEDFLLLAETTTAEFAEQIVTRRNDIGTAEATRVIDFDHFSKSVWHEMAAGTTSLNSSQYHRLEMEVSITIEKTVTNIKEQTPSNIAQLVWY